MHLLARGGLQVDHTLLIVGRLLMDRSLRALAVALALCVAAGAVLAQNVGTAGPARPKLKDDGNFPVRTDDGVNRYQLPYYFESGGGFADLESTVFYPPPHHLVTGEDGYVKYYIDPDDRTLTLWVRQPSSVARIQRDLREELATVALEEHQVDIMEGTAPYRITVLPLTRAHFEFTKSGTVSDLVQGAEIQAGNVAVHFRDVDETLARKLVDDLDRDVTQLLFHYRFPAISDEECSATFSKQGVQGIDLFKKVKGEGGRGFVTRHQAAQIADELVAEEIFTIRCADGGQLADLHAILLGRVAKLTERRVSDADDLDALVAFDANTFKADVTKSLKRIEKEVVRDQALDAFSEAMSEAESNAGEAGINLGFKGVSLGFSHGFADASAEAKAEAKKSVTDALRKQGMSINWNGLLAVPKTVDVYSVADLDARWSGGVQVRFQIPEGAEVAHKIRLTAQDRIVPAPDPGVGGDPVPRIEALERKLLALQAELRAAGNRAVVLGERFEARLGDIQDALVHRIDRGLAHHAGLLKLLQAPLRSESYRLRLTGGDADRSVSSDFATGVSGVAFPIAIVNSWTVNRGCTHPVVPHLLVNTESPVTTREWLIVVYDGYRKCTEFTVAVTFVPRALAGRARPPESFGPTQGGRLERLN